MIPANEVNCCARCTEISNLCNSLFRRHSSSNTFAPTPLPPTPFHFSSFLVQRSPFVPFLGIILWLLVRSVCKLFYYFVLMSSSFKFVVMSQIQYKFFFSSMVIQMKAFFALSSTFGSQIVLRFWVCALRCAPRSQCLLLILLWKVVLRSSTCTSSGAVHFQFRVAPLLLVWPSVVCPGPRNFQVTVQLVCWWKRS